MSQKPTSYPNVKNCTGCHEQFKRPATLNTSQWKSRKTCSTECLKIIKDAHNKKLNEAKFGVGCLDDKPCEECGTIITLDDVRARGYRPAYFINLKLCSLQCSARHRGRNSRGVKLGNNGVIKEKKRARHTIAAYWSRKNMFWKLQHLAMTSVLIRGKSKTKVTENDWHYGI